MGRHEPFEAAMNKIRAATILTLTIAAGAFGSYVYIHRSDDSATSVGIVPQATAAERSILYYRDPTGAPSWSATPKTDAQGRAYLPGYDEPEPKFDPPRAVSLPPLTPLNLGQGERKILYYRNPMGLPDTSPVP